MTRWLYTVNCRWQNLVTTVLNISTLARVIISNQIYCLCLNAWNEMKVNMSLYRRPNHTFYCKTCLSENISEYCGTFLMILIRFTWSVSHDPFHVIRFTWSVSRDPCHVIMLRSPGNVLNFSIDVWFDFSEFLVFLFTVHWLHLAILQEPSF